jgi:hypothetical protein
MLVGSISARRPCGSPVADARVIPAKIEVVAPWALMHQILETGCVWIGSGTWVMEIREVAFVKLVLRKFTLPSPVEAIWERASVRSRLSSISLSARVQTIVGSDQYWWAVRVRRFELPKKI